MFRDGKKSSDVKDTAKWSSSVNERDQIRAKNVATRAKIQKNGFAYLERKIVKLSQSCTTHVLSRVLSVAFSD